MRLKLPLALLALIGCANDNGQDGRGTTSTPTSGPTGATSPTTAPTLPDGTPAEYTFDSRFDGTDSVSYTGQVFRQLLIEDMKSHIGGLTDRLNTGFFPMSGDVEAELDFYFSFDSATSGMVPILYSSDPDPLQDVYNDISSDKDLVAKLAGNDETGQHRDWGSEFGGWPGATSPEGLVRDWMAQIDDASVAWASGAVPLDPTGQPVRAVYVTAEGVDLQQLLEKFLRGGVAFSQGTDDYLDDDIEGKGLNADHAVAEEGKSYTALEHAWDEAFGYFGAARDYGTWTDDDIADLGERDTNEDGSLDLAAEVCWGHSQNAAKRDVGSSADAPTDLTLEAWEGFALGRQLLASSEGPLEAADMAALQAHRDQAVGAWEKALAASVVHYVNDALQDLGTAGTEDYAFGDHAKHWSELKGFALALQFNPRSPLGSDDFDTLHGLIGQRPADVMKDDLDARMDDLVAARELLGDVYGFDAANLGDAFGEGGW